MSAVCLFCGKTESLISKLLKCGRCLSLYCDATCQKDDYGDHKTICKNRKNGVRAKQCATTEMNKVAAIWSWFSSISQGEVYIRIVCLAWTHRTLSPIIYLVGDSEGKANELVVVSRDEWAWSDDGGTIGWDIRFAGPDFKRDHHFFLEVKANHPGTGQWPHSAKRFSFPHDAKAMGSWVEQFSSRQKAPSDTNL